ncbi:winged helix-turn-helix domain-containing protein [Micromonospora sp. NPDC049559]|uniref:winged helix-turn-helix domain-containing protein n=1 Tax=Micromonospora sp. NPDC049559 TaxID=3155923 RepID=UPI003444E4FC
MTDETAAELALRHPLRAALLRLVREVGTVTSNDAARRLGESSGACSFHLRQLARYGYLEQAGDGRGRTRPWRLRTGPAGEGVATIEQAATVEGAATAGKAPTDLELGPLARDLEDEGYRRWLALRPAAPERWQRDEAFSTVLYLTPDELATVSAAVRDVLAPYQRREGDPGQRPAAAGPVAFVTRLFPLLPAERADGGATER